MEVIDHTNFKEKFLFILLQHQIDTNHECDDFECVRVCSCGCGCECLCMWINKRMFKHGMSNFRLMLYAIISLPTAWKKTKKNNNNNVNELWHSNNTNINNNIRNLVQILRNDNKTIEKELQAKLITRWITSFQIVFVRARNSLLRLFSLIRWLIKYETMISRKLFTLINTPTLSPVIALAVHAPYSVQWAILFFFAISLSY